MQQALKVWCPEIEDEPEQNNVEGLLKKHRVLVPLEYEVAKAYAKDILVGMDECVINVRTESRVLSYKVEKYVEYEVTQVWQ